MASTTCMIKAVIFDLNGVFIQSPKLSERFRDDYGVPEEEFLHALKEVLSKARLPQAGDSFMLWKPYLDKWNIHMSRKQFFDYWFRAEKEVPEVIEVARILRRRGIKVIILSNNFKERTAHYRKNFPFLQIDVDKAYFSWETGFVKPDERAYQLLLRENNLLPEECLYFDDSEHNVDVAAKLGIHSHYYTSNADLKKRLEEHELISD